MKTGLFGGTFNPVHLGHMRAAQEVLYRLGLDEIIFMPVYIPPHKESKNLASSEDRINMLSMVVEQEKKFSVSDLEVKRKGLSYTIDTLEFLKNEIKNEIYFIMGSDSFLSFQTWHRWRDILKISNLAVVYRPNFFYTNTGLINEGFYWKNKNCISHKEYNDIFFIDVKGLDVSSTEVRDFIKEKSDLCSYVDDKVAEYIEKKGLYK